MTDVTLIGTGVLGAAIGRRLLEGGHTLTVWNRSLEKARALVPDGAAVAETALVAVESSPVVFICVLNHRATLELLNLKGMRGALGGKVVVQTSDTTRDQSRELESFLQSADAQLVETAIGHNPRTVGTADGWIAACGAAGAYERAMPFLERLSQNLLYVGEEIGLAGGLYTASLGFYNGALLGIAHSVHLARAEGVPLDKLAPLMKIIGNWLGGESERQTLVRHAGDTTPSETPIRSMVDLIKQQRAYLQEQGLDNDFWSLMDASYEQGLKHDLGDLDIAALEEVVDELRERG